MREPRRMIACAFGVRAFGVRVRSSALGAPALCAFCVYPTTRPMMGESETTMETVNESHGEKRARDDGLLSPNTAARKTARWVCSNGDKASERVGENGDAIVDDSVDTRVATAARASVADADGALADHRLQATIPPPSGESNLRPVQERTCGICQEEFKSRNKMMVHVRERHPTGHGARGGCGSKERRAAKRARTQAPTPLSPAVAPALAMVTVETEDATLMVKSHQQVKEVDEPAMVASGPDVSSPGAWLAAAGLAKYAETIVSASDAESVDDFALLSTEEVEALVKGVGLGVCSAARLRRAINSLSKSEPTAPPPPKEQPPKPPTPPPPSPSPPPQAKAPKQLLSCGFCGELCCGRTDLFRHLREKHARGWIGAWPKGARGRGFVAVGEGRSRGNSIPKLRRGQVHRRGGKHYLATAAAKADEGEAVTGAVQRAQRAKERAGRAKAQRPKAKPPRQLRKPRWRWSRSSERTARRDEQIEHAACEACDAAVCAPTGETQPEAG
jgi:hypothetical protein